MLARHLLLSAALVLSVAANGSSATAADIVAEWEQAKAPPAPELKSVTAEARSTAVLMLDFMRQNCNEERRPRCVESLPAAKALLEKARAAGVPVVHTIIPNSTRNDIRPEVAPLEGEPHVQSGADKFRGTNLERLLAEKGIKTVIALGTAAHGAVLNTASGAAFRGLDVIVPVDAISAEDRYMEQYVLIHFKTAPTIASRFTLTRTSMLNF
jgi:nicotinamidase-related amidase